MWTYKQSTGYLTSQDGHQYGPGYSGHLDGLNDPDMQHVKDIGPIPQGKYTIGPPTEHKGPMTLSLVPDPANEMFGRDGFLIHGDEISHPGEFLASDGCIVLGFPLRNLIWSSDDHELQVVA